MTGLRGHEKFVWTPEAKDQMARLWAEGLPTERIGQIVGCGKNAVIGMRFRLGLPQRDTVAPRCVGALEPHLAEVRALAEGGMRASGIARKFNVSVGIAQKALDKLRRQGVDLPKMPKPPPKREAGQWRPAPTRRKPAPRPRSAYDKRQSAPAAPPPKAEPPAPPVVVVPRTSGSCMWPSVVADRIVFACTAGAEPGACSPYCAEHLARAWDPLPRRRAA